jgi:hypothetical protein
VQGIELVLDQGNEEDGDELNGERTDEDSIASVFRISYTHCMFEHIIDGPH